MTNKKALAVRGLNPYNQNLLLLDQTVPATILKEQLNHQEIIESGLFPTQQSSQELHNKESHTGTTNQICNPFNFNQGLGHYVATAIMTEIDRQTARATV